jgi:hypothetical protein
VAGQQGQDHQVGHEGAGGPYGGQVRILRHVHPVLPAEQQVPQGARTVPQEVEEGEEEEEGEDGGSATVGARPEQPSVGGEGATTGAPASSCGIQKAGYRC